MNKLNIAGKKGSRRGKARKKEKEDKKKERRGARYPIKGRLIICV